MSYTVTITHSVPTDHRVDVPTEYADDEFEVFVSDRLAAQGFNPDTAMRDVLSDHGADIARIAFDAAHGNIRSGENQWHW